MCAFMPVCMFVSIAFCCLKRTFFITILWKINALVCVCVWLCVCAHLSVCVFTCKFTCMFVYVFAQYHPGHFMQQYYNLAPTPTSMAQSSQSTTWNTTTISSWCSSAGPAVSKLWCPCRSEWKLVFCVMYINTSIQITWESVDIFLQMRKQHHTNGAIYRWSW